MITIAAATVLKQIDYLIRYLNVEPTPAQRDGRPAPSRKAPALAREAGVVLCLP